MLVQKPEKDLLVGLKPDYFVRRVAVGSISDGQSLGVTPEMPNVTLTRAEAIPSNLRDKAASRSSFYNT